MKKVVGWIVISILLVTVVITILYFFTSIGSGQDLLNDKQKDNLRKELVKHEDEIGFCYDEDYKMYIYKDGVIKIYGIEQKGDIYEVYGYCYYGGFIKHKGKAYVDSGGLGPFAVDVKVNGNDVKIIKYYGNTETPYSTYEEMPLRYRNMAQNNEIRHKEIDEKLYARVKAVLGVPVEEVFNLDMHSEDGKYKVYDMDEQANETIKEKGKIDEIVKENQKPKHD